MRRPVRIRKKELLKGDCKNNLDEGKNDLDLIPNYAVDNSPEKSNNCTERIVLKDQTNVIQRDQSPVISAPSSSNSLRYGLRRNNPVDYKKLSNGLHYGCDENKADLDIIKSLTPGCSNKIFKSVSNDKITADFKSNANSEVTSAFKISKPIYNIHTNTPRPRQSMTTEKKLAIYEFEVDENEPKGKQKKKRIRKVGEKKKLKKEPNKRIVAKNVAASLLNSKEVPFVRLVRLENEKKVLSPQNSPCIRNRTPAHNSVEHDSLPAQKENLSRSTFEVPVLFHNHHDATPAKKNTSMSKPGFSAMSDDEEMGKSQNDQLDITFFSNAKRSLDMKKKSLTKLEQNKRFFAKNVAASPENSNKVSFVRLAKLENKKKVLSSQNSSYLGNKTPSHNSVGHDSLSAQKENLSRSTFEVPVLFHNHQDATPAKKNTSVSKPGFNALSDNEEMNKSHKDQLDISFFSNAKRSLDMKEKTLKSSFSHDYSYDYQINASTPVKYNHYNITGNSSSIENCFGFDEPEVFEEPLISPIKNPAEGISNDSGEIVPTPHRFYQKQDHNCEKKEEIPVRQVIKMLKYGVNDDKLEIKSRSSSSSVSPIFNDPAAEDDKLTNITIKGKKLEKSVKPVPRRSYERPSFLRKKNKSYEEENSDSESGEDKKKKTFLTKKKHGPTKKEKEEMQKWINAFNSQCQEVEKYNLVVE